MKKLELFDKLEPLFEKTYFTSQEAKILGVSASCLAYYVRIGKLERVKRGVYRNLKTSEEIDFRWEDIAETVLSIKKGIICLYSALSIYDLSENLLRQHWIAIPNSSTTTKQSPLLKILRFRNMTLGATTITIGGVVVPIFDRERTIIDAFKLLSKETAIKALKRGLTQKIDLVKLQKYAKELRVNITPYLITLGT